MRLLLTFLLLFAATPAWAHQLLLSITPGPNSLAIVTSYGDNEPAAEARIRVTREAFVREAVTDAQGRSTLTDLSAGWYRVEAVTVGHRATADVEVGGAMAEVTPGGIPWTRVLIGLGIFTIIVGWAALRGNCKTCA